MQFNFLSIKYLRKKVKILQNFKLLVPQFFCEKIISKQQGISKQQSATAGRKPRP